MSAVRNHYLESSINQISRFLSLLDREFLSPSCGCFDRAYWHHRTKDFPSAASQQGILTLALIWKVNSKDNPYYKSDYIFELIKKSFNYTEQIQKKDGSFDEWYWNERGWAGPTGYVLHAVAQTYSIISHELNAEEKESYKNFIKKTASFLIRSWEKNILANHVAMAILAVAESWKILGDANIKSGLDGLIDKFQEYFHPDEGWSLEYDGADIGYQTGTLSFLSRVLSIYEDERIRKYCLGSLDFISYFCAPDGSLISHLGSRQTSNVFYYGFEYFKNEELGARLADFFYQGFCEKKSLHPGDQEDHYLIYRLPEFLESYELSARNMESAGRHSLLLPFERSGFVYDIKNAGIVIKNTDRHYIAFSYLRGGVLQIYNRQNGKSVLIDAGIAVKLFNGDIWSSLWIDQKNIFKLENDSWIVEAKLKKIRFPLFNPLKMLIFRIASGILGSHEKSAYYLKYIIRNLLMTNLVRSKIIFTRKVSFLGERIIIEDEMRPVDLSKQIKSILKGGIFYSRIIPQSKYFYPEELNFMAREHEFSGLAPDGRYKNRVEI